jgi:hypothetical protein
MGHQWGWTGSANRGDVAAQIVALMKRRGFEVSESARSASVTIQVAAGVVVGSGIAGDEIARELSRTFSVEGRFAEVELDDASVAATAHEVSPEGTLGPQEDLDELVTETCEEWFEGKKYRSEALDDLVALCLGMDDGPPSGGISLAFNRARVPQSGASVRVDALIDAVKGGARWEKIEVNGRPAIKVRDPNGSRTSLLDDKELEAFEAGVA